MSTHIDLEQEQTVENNVPRNTKRFKVENEFCIFFLYGFLTGLLLFQLKFLYNGGDIFIVWFVLG